MFHTEKDEHWEDTSVFHGHPIRASDVGGLTYGQMAHQVIPVSLMFTLHYIIQSYFILTKKTDQVDKAINITGLFVLILLKDFCILGSFKFIQ